MMNDAAEIVRQFRSHFAAENTAYAAWQALTDAIPDDHAVLVRLQDGKLRMVLFKMLDPATGKQSLTYSGPHVLDGRQPILEITVPEPKNERMASHVITE